VPLQPPQPGVPPVFGDPRALWNPAEGVRVVLRGRSEGFQCRSHGFDSGMPDKDWYRAAPAVLLQRGVTAAQWRLCMADLWRIHQEHMGDGEMGDICALLKCCCCIPLLLPWSALCDRFQSSMRTWLRRFNSMLQPHGAYAKFFTFAARGGRDFNIADDRSISCLTIAVSEREAARLRRTPVKHSKEFCHTCMCTTWCMPAH
jgi:hypothetical protein